MIKTLFIFIIITYIFITANHCPDGLTENVEIFQCKCYEFQTARTNWDNGRCTANGGRLGETVLVDC